MARKARNSDLKRHTHKGRRASGGGQRGYSVINDPRGIRGSGLRGDPRLAAPIMVRISPTPQGPERGYAG